MGALVAGALLLLSPALGFCAEGGNLSEQSFRTILILIAVGTVAFTVTHVFAEWLARRFGVVTGVEYIVLGAIIGPGFNVLTADTLVQVSPALVLGGGSLGLLAGILLNFRNRDSITARAVGVGFFVTVGTLIFVTALPLVASLYLFGVATTLDYIPHILCAGAIASVASQGPLRSLITFLDAKGEGGQIVLRVARVCSSFAVVAFGVIFCLFKPVSDLLPGVEPSPVIAFLFWFGVHLLIGLILGIVFTLFLIRDFEDEKILTVVIGMVIFSAGFAYFLKLSPIFVCFVLGVVLANVSKQSDHVVRMLLSVERPLYIVIFFFAGASIVFDVAWWAWLLAVPYLLLRGLGRWTGGFFGRALWMRMRRLPPVGTALLAPGALSAAMLLNFQQVFGREPFVPELFAALLLAIVVSEPMAYRFSRRWLIDATDVAPGPDRGDVS